MAHVVVLCSFLLIGEHAVSLVDPLELLFCTLLLADIRMVFPGEVAVCLLDLLVISVPWYSKDIVVVIRTHFLCSLFFHVEICIDNIIVSLCILVRCSTGSRLLLCSLL